MDAACFERGFEEQIRVFPKAEVLQMGYLRLQGLLDALIKDLFMFGKKGNPCFISFQRVIKE